MFLIGGAQSAVSASALDSVVSYNHTSQQWTEHTSFPQGPKYTCSASALDHRRLVVVGGEPVENSKRAVLYDVATQNWSPLPEMHADRIFHALVTADDKLYVMGGYKPRVNNWEERVEVLEDDGDDDRAKSWKPLPQGMRTLRGGCASVFHSVSGRIIVTGGDYGQGRKTYVYNSCEVYDTNGQSWNQTKLASMLTARAGHASVIVHDNLLVVIGGVDDSGTATAKVEALWLDNDDDSQEEWIDLPPMNTPRACFAAFVTPSGQGIIVAGGFDASRTVLDSMEFLPLTSPTRQTARTPVPKAPPLPPMPSLDQTDFLEQSKKWALDATNLKREYNERVEKSELDIRKHHQQRRKALEAQIAQDEQECKKQIDSIRAAADEWNTDVDRKILLAQNIAAQLVLASNPPHEVHVVVGDNQEMDTASSLTRLTLEGGPPPPPQPLPRAFARRGDYSTTLPPAPPCPANQDGRRG